MKLLLSNIMLPFKSSSKTTTCLSMLLLLLVKVHDASAELPLGSFTKRSHDLQGDVFALSDRVLEVRNMVYDGLGPAAFFWADTNPVPSANGLRLAEGIPSRTCGTQALPEANGDTFRFEFPEGTSLRDYVGGSIGVWCETARANFGELIIDANIDLSSLNTLALGEGPPMECGTLTIGTFTTRSHELAGEVVALSDRVVEVRNLVYDGLGPAAFFWADTRAVPSSFGLRLRDASPSRSCGTQALPEVRSGTVRFEFPEGQTIRDFAGGSLGVWCETAAENFGEVILTSPALGLLPVANAGAGPQMECAQVSLGRFTTRAHDLEGEVVALSDRVMEVRSMVYDGLGPAAFFWADTSATPTSNGLRLLDTQPGNSCGTDELPEARTETFRFEFPDGTTIHDYVGGSIGVWCETASQNFGEVVVGANLPLSTLPVSAEGRGPALECGESGGTSFAPTPEGYNCEELNDDFQIRWKVENDQVLMELIGRIEDDGYMAFGVSGSETEALMLGADPVVADFFEGSPRARDYYMNNRGQCSVDTGVCPDENASFMNDVTSDSVSGEREQGLTLVRYQRPAAPSNVNDLLTGYTVDRAMNVQSGELTTVVWALGPVDAVSGNPFFHSIDFSTTLIQFEFGRSVVDNCTPLQPKEDDDEEIFPFLRPVLRDTTEINAVIGPSGGDRGYASISGGRAAWGIAWFLNDILIPVVEMRRGTTYTFRVNGGDDEESPSQYHPFYLSDSVGGGYVQQSPENRLMETVFAGIQITNQTDEGVFEFEPTAVGPLCSYGETDASSESSTGGFLEYFSSLDTSCASDEMITSAAGVLEFTPDETTPDLIYYHCVTHTNLGWEIRVIDADAPSILDVNCDAFGSAPIQLTEDLTLNAIVDPIENTLTAELVYNGIGWVGMAFTNEQPVMVGAEAVIGLPDEPNSASNPAKYNLNQRSDAGVVRMPAEKQTLIDASITQENGKTTLKFTKLLFEDGEHPIFSDRSNTFLFAHGSSNTLGFHAGFGGFTLLPNQCAVRIAGELQNAHALNQQGQVGVDVADLNRPLWVAHGACAATAWGILVPLAIGASLVRKVFVKMGLPEGAWFQVHRALNMLAAILTLIAFSLAVRAINKGSPDDPNHFDSEILHRHTGLVIFILTMAQAINGILRPHVPHKETEEKEDTNDDDDEIGDTETPEKDESKMPPEQSTIEEKGPVRFGWEIFHRLLGFTLLGFTWWQVQDGLGLFSERFQEDNLDTVFWIVVSCLAGSIGAVAIFARVAL